MKTHLCSVAFGLFFLLPGWVFGQATNAPTALTATSVAFNQVILRWNDNSTGETKFEIERNTLTGFAKIGEANPNIVTYTDNSAQPNNTYTYRVKAILVTGASTAYSNQLTVNTPSEPPGVPTGFSVQYGNGGIRITWNNGPGGLPTDYQLERGDNANGPFSLYQTIPYSRTPGYTDAGVSGGRQYCYRVRSRGAGGTSAFTSGLCASVPLAPSNVRNLKAAAQNPASIKVTWDRYGKESPITIQRSPGPNGPWTNIAPTLADAGEYTDNTVSGGREYCYRIAEAGHEVSVQACATTPPSLPTPPVRLEVNATAYNRIVLRWADQSDNETGFQIERSENGIGGPYQKLGSDLGINTQTFTDETVQGSRQYCYQVRAINGAGASAFLGPLCATTPPPPAGIPQNLQAVATSTTQISLTWVAVAGASGYQLERSPNGTDGWQNIGPSPATATSFLDNGRTPNNRYYYRVRALNAAGVAGDFSGVVSALTPDVPPTAPARLTITAVSFNQISLQWADLSQNESGFIVERSTDNVNWEKIAEPGQNATTYDDKTVAPQTRYYYRVRAVNGAGQSGNSNVVDTTTPPGPPVAPQNLQAVATSTTQISLTWGAIANATTIVIERSNDGTSGWSTLTTVAGNSTSFVDNSLTPNQRYFYRVRPTNGSGTGGNSNVADATTPDTPPAAPARLTATATRPNQITLNWADLSQNESGFVIERSNSPTGNFEKIAERPLNTTTYEDNTVAETTQYCYRVRAVNAAGSSLYTDVGCATTPLAPPATPANLRAELADYDQIRVSWPGLPASVSTVIVERSTSPSGSFSAIGQVPANQGAYVDKNLAELTTYYYRIRAVNSAGQSGNSNVVNVTTPEAIIGTEDPILAGATAFVADRQLVIRFDHAPVGTVIVNLLRLTGQTAFTESVRLGHTGQWMRSVESLPTGVYVVILEDRERNARAGRKVFIP